MFKFEISKFFTFKNTLNPLFINVIAHSVTCIFTKKALFIREFIFFYVVFNLLTIFSYRNLFKWIVYPINPLCAKEYQNVYEVLKKEFNLNRKNRFMNYHFLQNLYFIMENTYHVKLIKKGNKTNYNFTQKDGYFNNEDMENLRNFFEFIVKNLKKENEKIYQLILYKEKSVNIKNLFTNSQIVSFFCKEKFH